MSFAWLWLLEGLTLVMTPLGLAAWGILGTVLIVSLVEMKPIVCTKPWWLRLGLSVLGGPVVMSIACVITLLYTWKWFSDDRVDLRGKGCLKFTSCKGWYETLRGGLICTHCGHVLPPRYISRMAMLKLKFARLERLWNQGE